MIQSVKSNLKGGVDAKLGKLTLIVGRNASGKSSIIQAVELALSGAASDVAGRALMAAGAELQMLTPPDESKLWAEVVSDIAGVEPSRFEAIAGKTPKRTGPEARFPLREVRAALLGSVETARKALLGWAGGSGWEHARSCIPTDLHPSLDALGNATGQDLAASIEEAKRRGRECAAEAKREEAAVARGAQGAVPLTAAARKALEAGLAAARQNEAALAFEGARSALAGAGESFKEAAGRQADARLREQRARAAQGSAETAPRALEAALEVAEALAAEDATECAICGSTVPRGTFATRAARAREAAKTLPRAGAAAAELRDAQADLAMANRDVDRLGQEIDRLKATLATAPPEVVQPPKESAALLEAHLRADDRAAMAWGEISQARARASAATRKEREWKDIAQGLAKAMGDEVERAKADFEGRVQRWMPEGMRFGVDLQDGDREVLRVGLRGGVIAEGSVRAALSGAEWATVTAALALAIAKDGDVIVPEERAFDPDTLAEVLRAFEEAARQPDAPKVQIIVASPVPPAGEPREWTVIHTGPRSWRDGPTTEKAEAAKAGDGKPAAATVRGLFAKK